MLQVCINWGNSQSGEIGQNGMESTVIKFVSFSLEMVPLELWLLHFAVLQIYIKNQAKVSIMLHVTMVLLFMIWLPTLKSIMNKMVKIIEMEVISIIASILELKEKQTLLK